MCIACRCEMGGVWLSRFELRCYSCDVNHRSCLRLTLTPCQLNASPIQPRRRHHDCLDRHAETLVVAHQPLLHYTTQLFPYLNLGPSMHGHENLRLDLHCRNCG